VIGSFLRLATRDLAGAKIAAIAGDLPGAGRVFFQMQGQLIARLELAAHDGIGQAGRRLVHRHDGAIGHFGEAGDLAIAFVVSLGGLFKACAGIRANGQAGREIGKSVVVVGLLDVGQEGDGGAGWTGGYADGIVEL